MHHRETVTEVEVFTFCGVLHTRTKEIFICSKYTPRVNAMWVDQILNSHVVPSSRKIDAHFSKTKQDLLWQESLEYLQQLQIETLPWPSKSPDLNRDELERCLRRRQQALKNLQEHSASDAVLEEWE